jgi:hypothetical protein
MEQMASSWPAALAEYQALSRKFYRYPK